MWIHEHLDWPNFTWDYQVLASKLARIRHYQGRLLGRMEGLGLEFSQETCLVTLTNDVIKSSAIEGEGLNLKEVQSSVARRLGINIPDPVSSSRHVEGIVAMTLDATQQYSRPLSKDRPVWLARRTVPNGL